MSKMIAQFLLTPARLLDIAERNAKKSGTEIGVEIHPIGNGHICGVVGETLAVMLLIGAVAAEGEDALFKAEMMS